VGGVLIDKLGHVFVCSVISKVPSSNTWRKNSRRMLMSFVVHQIAPLLWVLHWYVTPVNLYGETVLCIRVRAN